jgi:hypothetical protein
VHYPARASPWFWVHGRNWHLVEWNSGSRAKRRRPDPSAQVLPLTWAGVQAATGDLLCSLLGRRSADFGLIAPTSRVCVAELNDEYVHATGLLGVSLRPTRESRRHGPDPRCLLQLTGSAGAFALQAQLRRRGLRNVSRACSIPFSDVAAMAWLSSIACSKLSRTSSVGVVANS